MALSDWDKEMLALLDGRATHLPNVRKGLNKSQISAKAVDAYRDAQAAQQTADDAYADAQDALNGTILDDGTNPAVPTATAPAVELRPRSLIVTWDPPARLDFVKHTIVTVERPAGTVVRTRNVVGTTTVFSSLVADVAHRVKLQHVDIFGHTSTVLTVGDFTPTAVIVGSGDAIDLGSATKTGTLAAGFIGAGTISTGTINVASTLTVDPAGTINAGGTAIGSTGVTLSDASKLEGSFPGNAGDWITPKAGANVPSPFAGFGFFNETGSRGIVVRASGASGGANVGRVIISADNGDQNPGAATSARIRLLSEESGSGKVEITGELDATKSTGLLSPGGQWSAPGTVAAGGIHAKRIDKLVILSGQVHNNSPGINGNLATICNLPADFRPSYIKRISVPFTNAAGFWDLQRRIGIEPGGVVRLLEGTDNEVPAGQDISLDGVCFTID